MAENISGVCLKLDRNRENRKSRRGILSGGLGLAG